MLHNIEGKTCPDKLLSFYSEQVKVTQIIQIILAVVILVAFTFSLILAKHVKDKAADLGKGAQKLYGQLNELDTEGSLPGAQAMQRAREFLEVGDYSEAREKLLFITNFYSEAPFASRARKILGEMNLDQFFSPDTLKEKSEYTIKRGDSLSKIAKKHECTVEYIMALNGLSYPDRIQPGQKLIVRPINFKTVIDAKQRLLTLVDDGKYIKEYPLLEVTAKSRSSKITTKIDQALGYDKSSTFPRSSSSYQKNKKMVLLKDGNWLIRGVKHPDEIDPGSGFFLSESNMEEYSILIKSGDPVEIRL